MNPATGWQYVPVVSVRRKTKSVDPALSVKGSGLFSFQTRSSCTPATASTYDIDSEHAYIMAKALRSYREHRRREETGASRPASLHRQYIKAAAPVSMTGEDESTAGCSDDASRPKPVPRCEYNLPARERRCRSAVVGPVSPAQEPLMLVMTRRNRPPTAGGFHVASSLIPGCVDAIGQVGKANAARVLRPTTSRWLQRTSLAWPFSMDKIGEKERGPSRYQCESTCFASTSSPRESFTIHPDWVSENLTVAKINLKERTCSVPQCDMTRSARSPLGITGYPMRRCASAPPSRTRNPITWEYS